MRILKNLSKLQIAIFALLVLTTSVLGYLFYDSYHTRIQDKELLKKSEETNQQLSYDIDKIKDQHNRLSKKVDSLNSKFYRVSFHKKKYSHNKLYSAGKRNSGRHKISLRNFKMLSPKMRCKYLYRLYYGRTR